jgi:hypothetical protein
MLADWWCFRLPVAAALRAMGSNSRRSVGAVFPIVLLVSETIVIDDG